MAVADTVPPETTVASIFNRTGVHLEAKGRKDNDGQPAVPQPSVLREHAKELIALANAAAKAGAEYGDRIKVVAEKSGFNAAEVRKLIAARVKGDEAVADRLRKAEQMVLLLKDCGE